MKKIAGLAVALLITALAFQNCDQTEYSSPEGGVGCEDCSAPVFKTQQVASPVYDVIRVFASSNFNRNYDVNSENMEISNCGSAQLPNELSVRLDDFININPKYCRGYWEGSFVSCMSYTLPPVVFSPDSENPVNYYGVQELDCLQDTYYFCDSEANAEFKEIVDEVRNFAGALSCD
ncbi:MAG: hypothetical protein KDD25_01850 [Bdellovibrionales bacterium]|nr:hypothetical protein [Bdellovibrionales bacterium]